MNIDFSISTKIIYFLHNIMIKPWVLLEKRIQYIVSLAFGFLSQAYDFLRSNFFKKIYLNYSCKKKIIENQSNHLIEQSLFSSLSSTQVNNNKEQKIEAPEENDKKSNLVENDLNGQNVKEINTRLEMLVSSESIKREKKIAKQEKIEELSKLLKKKKEKFEKTYQKVKALNDQRIEKRRLNERLSIDLSQLSMGIQANITEKNDCFPPKFIELQSGKRLSDLTLARWSLKSDENKRAIVKIEQEIASQTLFYEKIQNQMIAANIKCHRLNDELQRITKSIEKLQNS